VVVDVVVLVAAWYNAVVVTAVGGEPVVAADAPEVSPLVSLAVLASRLL